MGILCNLYKLYFRNDPCNHDQPERYKGKGILEILFCTFLCSADVCISFDHAYHAAAGRCGQCTVKKLRVDRAGCKSPVFHRSDLGESDCDRGQYLVGVPYTLLQLTGVLQNIPADLYEAARVDGANSIQIFFKITLPYMLYVTTPYLIATFTGNVNNFNIIYLLSGGDPITDLSSTAGSTDLLVT